MNTENIQARFNLCYPEFSLDVDLTFPGRGVTALFGHSGSGKTTLLRCIAGLERVRHGLLTVNGERWQEDNQYLPTYRRPLGYVFQEASLFPHLSARGNIAYGMKRAAAPLQAAELEHIIDLLGIGHLLERKPDQLSGGERQRVAIARALAVNPRLLLMDEPLAALDRKRKQEILPYLERLHRELDIPVIYVSHSLKEVTRLADHMVWLEAGKVLAEGPLNEVLGRLDVEAAWEEEAGSVLDAVVAEHDSEYHLTALDSRCGRLWVRRLELGIGAAVRVRLPARDISLSLEPDRASSILNVWPATVESIAEAAPGQVYAGLRTDAEAPVVVARITRRSCEALRLEPGTLVYARIKSVGLLE